MEFEKVKRVGKYFEKYLTYEGINLYKLSESAMYNNFLRDERVPTIFERSKGVLAREVCRLKNKGREKRSKEAVCKKNIIIVSGITHVKMAERLIRKGANLEVILYESLGDNSTREYLDRKKIEYNYIDSYINQRIRKKISRDRKILLRKYNLIRMDPEIKKKLGEDYNILMKVFKYFVVTRDLYFGYIRLIELYKALLESVEPNSIIVFDDVNAYGRSAVLVARTQGVKTICLQHGQLQGNPVGEITTDVMAVNGESDREYLVSRGAQRNKIKVVGQIMFDGILESDSCKNTKGNKKTVVFTAQKNAKGQSVSEVAKNVFLKEIKKIEPQGDYEFIVTIREDMTKKDLPKEIEKSNARVIRGGDIHKIIKYCDVLITAYSTAAIEAVLLGKPVITLNIGTKEYIDYTKLGVGFRVLRKEDFLPSLMKVLYDKKTKKMLEKSRKEFVKKFNYKLDGRAAERIISLIK